MRTKAQQKLVGRHSSIVAGTEEGGVKGGATRSRWQARIESLAHIAELPVQACPDQTAPSLLRLFRYLPTARTIQSITFLGKKSTLRVRCATHLQSDSIQESVVLSCTNLRETTFNMSWGAPVFNISPGQKSGWQQLP